MKKGEDNYIKLGNISFHKEGVKIMTYKQFMATYTGVLKGYDIKKAAKELGLKMPKKETEDK